MRNQTNAANFTVYQKTNKAVSFRSDRCLIQAKFLARNCSRKCKAYLLRRLDRSA